MADDIDVQILNLERLSATYYRFVPPSIIGLLGKNNLAALTLGSNVKGNFAVLNVRMYPEESLPLDQTEALMNRFFNTVNRFAQQSDMIPIVDDANLQTGNPGRCGPGICTGTGRVWSNQYGSWLHTGKDGDDLNNRLSTVEN